MKKDIAKKTLFSSAVFIIAFSLILMSYLLFLNKKQWEACIKEPKNINKYGATKVLYNNEKRVVKIALIDSEISNRVSYWSSKVWINNKEKVNGVDDDRNGFVDDISGWNFTKSSPTIYSRNPISHGTSLMFLLIGRGVGYRSMLYNIKCSVMIIPVVSESGGARMSNVISAIKYAEDNGAKICNLSLTTYINDKQLFDTIKNSKMLFVVPSGNEGSSMNYENKVYPACYRLKNVCCVGAIERNGELASFANYNPDYVDAVAPGVEIFSKNSKNEWEFFSGTTYSTVFATALAARESFKNPNFNASEIKRHIAEKLQLWQMTKLEYEGLFIQIK